MKVFGLEIRKSAVKNDTKELIPVSNTSGGIFYFHPKMTIGELLANTTVASCVYIISDAIASLVWHVYKNVDGSDERSKDLSLAQVLEKRPNDSDSPFTFKQQVMLHLLLKGNAFIFIERNRDYSIRSLTPLDPDMVQIKRTDDGEVYYVYTVNGISYKYNAETILHIPAIRYNRLRGLSPMEYSTYAAKTGLQLEEYTSDYFTGGIHSKVFLTVPKEVTNWTKENSDELSARFLEAYGGRENANKPVILNKGLTHSIESVSGNVDSQLVENRAFSEKEIAKIFRVPLYMLGKDTAKFTNMEQLNTFFLQQTLNPWIVRLNEYFSKLIPSWLQDEYSVKFNPNTILRADYNTRLNGYAKGFNMGLYSINELRAMENLPRIEEENAEKHFVQLNMSTIDNLGKDDGQPDEGSKNDDDK